LFQILSAVKKTKYVFNSDFICHRMFIHKIRKRKFLDRKFSYPESVFQYFSNSWKKIDFFSLKKFFILTIAKAHVEGVLKMVAKKKAYPNLTP